MTLADYAVKLANVRKNQVKFVILYGSAAVGQDRRYSDFDVMVVTKGRITATSKTRELFGVFNGRLFTGSIQDFKSLKEDWTSRNDYDFVWRIEQIRKAKVLYGDAQEFQRIKEAALKKKWTRDRQFAVIRHSYSTMVEYMGKMLNKMDGSSALEFYQNAYIIAWQAALFVATINRINLSSDNEMFRQVFRNAKIRPPNFKRDIITLFGFSIQHRKKETIVQISKKMVQWARSYITRYSPFYSSKDTGFNQIVREIKF
jgi:hypothetical protein